MRRYRRFAVWAVLFMALPWYAALKTDMFWTAVACVPPFFFFLAGFILAMARMIGRKEIRQNLIIMVSCVLLAISLGAPSVVANRGLHGLTEERIATMKKLRPIFVQYRKENGTYPPSLEDLVPEYISEIPAELVNDGRDDPYKKISYRLIGADEAQFHFHTIRGPDSSAIYHIHENTFWHDR